ncbi:unnamed protein product [Gongylonema pulchrum]|uniref:Transposase n=1 Tax=Gongylonema pulchrum TaxID=637853 RepID=A0A183EXR6_9BILA|nr:unnamed protein product [Gongylonema pulchrum]
MIRINDAKRSQWKYYQQHTGQHYELTTVPGFPAVSNRRQIVRMLLCTKPLFIANKYGPDLNRSSGRDVLNQYRIKAYLRSPSKFSTSNTSKNAGLSQESVTTGAKVLCTEMI